MIDHSKFYGRRLICGAAGAAAAAVVGLTLMEAYVLSDLPDWSDKQAVQRAALKRLPR